MRWFFWTLFALAAAGWLGDAVHQHAAGLGSVQAAFAGLPATMAVLAVGLLPIVLMLPLIYFEQDLKIKAAETASAALKIEAELKKTASAMLAMAETAVGTTTSILQIFLAWSLGRLGHNQTLICLTPRILAQRPIHQPAFTGCPA
uniref:Uncharacterized protein n=1 Tax=mine drainage metagenome TaxID=410659 RepID=E6PKN7_9ZZZZ